MKVSEPERVINLKQPFEIKLFHDFSAVKNHWQKIEQQSSAYIFQTYHWLDCWFQCLGKRDSIKPCLVLVTVNNEPYMLLPLALKVKWSIVCLTCLGGQMSDFHALLIKPQAISCSFVAIWAAIEAILPKYDVIHFIKLPEKIAGLNNPLLTLPGQSIQARHYYCILENDWETFSHKQFSSKFRSDLRRRRALLEKKGDLCFVIAKTRVETQQMIEVLIHQKSQQYQQTGTHDIFQYPEYRNFFNILLNSSHPLHNNIHLSALKLNQNIIAVHWGMIYQGRFYHFMPSFDRSWAQYAPGKLLLEALFKWSFQQHLSVFDFTIGDEPYKKPWASHQEDLFQILQIKTKKGQIWAALEKSKDWIRETPLLHQQINKWRNFSWARCLPDAKAI